MEVSVNLCILFFSGQSRFKHVIFWSWSRISGEHMAFSLQEGGQCIIQQQKIPPKHCGVSSIYQGYWALRYIYTDIIIFLR